MVGQRNQGQSLVGGDTGNFCYCAVSMPAGYGMNM